ncbi:MAG: MFS transporter [Acidobacteria bacterium]|nr:MFS transporter [Acidobacteriota bacterium]MBI3657321.1 MFS transporter [Acidobacteriota bacterium]
MTWNLRWRLSLMMFMQYAIWGAWNPVLGAYLEKLGFTGVQTGNIYNALPLACMVAPFIGGQVVDRYMPTQWFLALAHMLGGATLILCARQHSFGGILLLMMLFSFLYAPTLALTNSLSFHHIKNPEKEFGGIRVWGTIGWIAAGLVLSLWRTQRPSSSASDCLYLGGIAAILLGGFSAFLPHTPPRRSPTASPWAFADALRLLKDKNFSIFLVISFVVSTELMFYYMLTAPFLETIGVSPQKVSAVMTIGQIAEIATMAIALPYFLPKYGVRKCLAIGVLAWPIRYAVFSIGGPTWLVVASLSLHGICYVFFFTVAQVYVDSVAPPNIRASAQTLLNLVTLGLGLLVGGIFAGKIKDIFTVFGPNGQIQSINYTGVFLVPCALTILCAMAFLLTFRQKPAPPQNGAPVIAK